MIQEQIQIKRGSARQYTILIGDSKQYGTLVSETMDCAACEHINSVNIIRDSSSRYRQDNESIMGVCTEGESCRVIVKRKKKKRCAIIAAIKRNNR